MKVQKNQFRMKNCFELKIKIQAVQNEIANRSKKRGSCTYLSSGLKDSYLFEKTSIKKSLVLDLFLKRLSILELNKNN